MTKMYYGLKKDKGTVDGGKGRVCIPWDSIRSVMDLGEGTMINVDGQLIIVKENYDHFIRFWHESKKEPS